MFFEVLSSLFHMRYLNLLFILDFYETRIKEEYLWESEQIGSYSPQALQYAILYGNMKYFKILVGIISNIMVT